VEELWNDDEESGDDDDDQLDDETEVGGMNIDGEDEDEENEDEDEKEDEEASDAETGDSQEDETDAEDEGDSEIELPRLSRNQQKRKRGPERSMPSPPAKKVAFSVVPPAESDRQKIELKTTKVKLKEPMKTALQKKPLKKPVQVSSRAAMKKSLSKFSPKAVHKTSEKKGKVANVTAKKKAAEGSLALARQSKDKSESEAYDFGKFF
jgi:nuclear GTP-binding protein